MRNDLQIRKTLIIANGSKSNCASFLANITGYLEKMDVQCDSFMHEDYDISRMPQDYDMIISLGGDGTILKTIHDFHSLNIPIFGINNGHLGFITPYTKSDWKSGLKTYISGQQRQHSERIMLKVEQKRKGKRILCEKAVNEIYLHRPDSRAMIRIKADVNGQNLADFLSADGIIIATPTGSTAYSMAAGASILSTDMKAFIFMPNNPFMSIDRGMVFGDKTKITLTLVEPQKTDEGIIDLDGRFMNNFKTSDTLEITIADQFYTLITNPKLSEYERLGEKLKWKKGT